VAKWVRAFVWVKFGVFEE